MARPTSGSTAGRLLLVAGLVAVALISTAATAFVGCAAHEVAHAAVGSALGYEVVALEVCPGNASVSWAASDLAPIDGTVEAWAGGILASALLAGVYLVVALVRRLPAGSATWWVVALPLPAVAAGQLLIGVMEGMSQGLYGQLIEGAPGVWVPLIGATFVGGALVHVALYPPWRLFRRTDD